MLVLKKYKNYCSISIEYVMCYFNWMTLFGTMCRRIESAEKRIAWWSFHLCWGWANSWRGEHRGRARYEKKNNYMNPQQKLDRRKWGTPSKGGGRGQGRCCFEAKTLILMMVPASAGWACNAGAKNSWWEVPESVLGNFCTPQEMKLCFSLF